MSPRRLGKVSIFGMDYLIESVFFFFSLLLHRHSFHTARVTFQRHSHTLTLSHSHTLTLALSHCRTLALSHSRTLNLTLHLLQISRVITGALTSCCGLDSSESSSLLAQIVYSLYPTRSLCSTRSPYSSCSHLYPCLYSPVYLPAGDSHPPWLSC